MEAFELESAILRLTVSTTSESESEAVESSETETKQPSEDSKLSEPQQGSESEGNIAQSTAARSQIAPVFSACLPIVRARAGNIAMAQQLVEGAKQNLSMTIHLESLGIGGDDGDYYDDEDED